MKQTLLFFSFLLFGIITEAQQKIEVSVNNKTMSKGQQMAITVLIPEAKTKDIESIWKNYINNRSLGERMGNIATGIGNIFRTGDNQVKRDNLKVEKIGDEWYVRSIEEASLTYHSLDVYARTADLPEGCQFNAFFQYTDSVFINESNIDAERLESMKTFIHDFGVEAYKSVVDDQIKEAKKEVSNQEDIFKKIEKNTRKEEKAISRCEVDIQEYEAEIKGVENDIARMEELIAEKKLTFSTLPKDDPAYDLTKLALKDLAKSKSKSFKSIKSIRSKIKSKEMDIKSSKTKIAQDEVKILAQQKIIEEREKIVQDLELKKERID
ncbi:MAG: hypothetical protein WAO52_08415 [Prolixibacteraceae bacterium]